MRRAAGIAIMSAGRRKASAFYTKPCKERERKTMKATIAAILTCGAAACGLVLGCGAANAGVRPEEWAKPVKRAGVPNLHKVSDALYRSAQPTAEGMTNLVALGIKTVVNLRDNHSDADEIGDLPLKARRIEIFTGNMKDRHAKELLAIMGDTNAVPVLVHCQHGADRTGTMCAMYRVMRQGWSADKAIDEMKNGGYGYHSVWANLPRFVRESSRRLKASEPAETTASGSGVTGEGVAQQASGETGH